MFIKNNNPDIVCILGTHLVSSDEKELQTFPDCEVIVHRGKTNLRGDGILL